MSSVEVFSLRPHQIEKLRHDLEERGFEFTTPPHSHFQARGQNVVVTAYQSGKMTVSGKGMQEFVQFYLEPDLLENFDRSTQALTEKQEEPNLILEPHMGSDEAGKGDYFGPLCICAFYGDEAILGELKKIGVKDSKLLSDDKLLKMAPLLRKFPHELMVLTPKTYNSLYEKFGNLNRMLAWCHTKILSTLSERVGCKRALIDQFAPKATILPFMKAPLIPDLIDVRVRAENDPFVAAASLLARSAFLETLSSLSKEYQIQLPKGATHVKDALARFIAKWGRDALVNVAKIHFKTTKEI